MRQLLPSACCPSREEILSAGFFFCAAHFVAYTSLAMLFFGRAGLRFSLARPIGFLGNACPRHDRRVCQRSRSCSLVFSTHPLRTVSSRRCCFRVIPSFEQGQPRVAPTRTGEASQAKWSIESESWTLNVPADEAWLGVPWIVPSIGSTRAPHKRRRRVAIGANSDVLFKCISRVRRPCPPDVPISHTAGAFLPPNSMGHSCCQHSVSTRW